MGKKVVKKIMQTLTLKEHRAIEYRYMGVPHKEIAGTLGVPKETVDGWFKARGILSPYYKLFADDVNAKRKVEIEKQLYLSDNEILSMCRLLVRRFSELLLLGHKKVLMQKGEPLLDENGNVRYYYEPYRPSFSDFINAWKIQRVMRNLPIGIREKRCPSCKTITRMMH